MVWDDGLGGVHYEIASSDHPRIGVLAGPGTGKTTYGLLRRVARLLETEACTPEEVLLLTFTRTAAHDLVDKVADLGSSGVERVRAGTVHGFCFALLKRESVLAITNRQPRMLLEHEAKLMLRDLEGDFGNLADRQKRLHAFEAGWARANTDHPGLALDPADQSFEAQVVAWLRHHRAMLIGEVVPIAFQYLKNNPQAEERAKFKHVIVDEYQDLNTLERIVRRRRSGWMSHGRPFDAIYETFVGAASSTPGQSGQMPGVRPRGDGRDRRGGLADAAKAHGAEVLAGQGRRGRPPVAA